MDLGAEPPVIKLCCVPARFKTLFHRQLYNKEETFHSIAVIQVLSERRAVVWNWAEEWKEKLNQALIDWQNLREEEAALLSWLSSKEKTFDLIGETDITNEEQVTMNLNLLEVRTFHFSYQ